MTFALARCRDNSSQLAQDLWMLYELGEKRGGYFVEFGAGVLVSNTYLLEVRYGWRDVLVEANPVFHAALRRNRKAHISVKCIAEILGASVSFSCTPDPHFSTIDTYSATDSHAAIRTLGERIFVRTHTLNDLLPEGGAPRKIDYVSVDTEGREYAILAAFDFSASDIALITVEHNCTDRERQLDELLARNGFERRFRELTEFNGRYINQRHLARAKTSTRRS